MAPISQREARRLQKRVAHLEHILTAQRRQYARDYPGGVNISTCVLDVSVIATIRTARRLRHAVVVVSDDGSQSVRFMALPHPSEPI